MWFVPTRGRPHRLQKFLDGCEETHMSMPGLIVVDGRDAAAGDYSSVALPKNWTLTVAEHRAEVGGRMEAFYREHPKAKFYSIINDDVVPETPFWDIMLADTVEDWNVAYPNDTLTAIATQFLVGGKLCRAVGSFSLGFIHTMVDRAWMDIGNALNRLCFRKDVRLRHEHHSRNALLWDQTYVRDFDKRGTNRLDHARYNRFKAGDFPKLVECLQKIVPEK